jgi:hypothetical protein
MYGGGSRSSSGGGFAALIGALMVLAIVFIVVMWPLSLWGHAIHLTPSWHQLMNRDHAWMHDHYSLVGLRYVGAALILALAFFLASLPFWGVVERRAEERRRLRAAADDEAERQAELARQAWLQSPPPPLPVPGRFTQRWIEENVPYLHPGQGPVLMDELHARGWKDERIVQRVAPYLPD